MDTFTASARYVFDQTLGDIRRSLDGLEPVDLNRRPGPDTNAIAVLVVHSMSSTRWWLSVATGAPLPDRDRDSEFEASAPDSEALRAWFEDIAKQCQTLLDTQKAIDWSAMLEPDPGEQKVPASFALIHAMAHLREHEGQMSLSRQLLAAGSAGGRA